MTSLSAEGPNGSVTVDDDWVTIKRTNIRSKLTHGFDGQKRIPMSSITAVQFKSVGGYGKFMGKLNRSSTSAVGPATGYIQFVLLGSSESKGGLMAAQYDENTVMFNNVGEPEFEKIRDFVEQRIIALRDHGRTTVIQEADVADQILKLSQLRDQGILTEDEFQARKTKLLS